MSADEKEHSDLTQDWKVYIILSSDGRLYTGITNNFFQRWQKHSSGKGAKFFYGRKPVALQYLEGEHDRSSASKREYELKQLNRQQKWRLITKYYGPVNPE